MLVQNLVIIRLDPNNNQASHVFTFLVPCSVEASESYNVYAPVI